MPMQAHSIPALAQRVGEGLDADAPALDGKDPHK